MSESIDTPDLLAIIARGDVELEARMRAEAAQASARMREEEGRTCPSQTPRGVRAAIAAMAR